MQPDKILFVDDEPMAVKYFDRLVSPFAPVLSANSVAEAKEILRTRASEVAVLVSDQRMPVAQGNELLAFAREHYPNIVRMLTTAYSELGDAIQAVNSGEIFRYLPKPWDLESLRADLKNALELAHLRYQRELLLREKMMLGQRQLVASRIAMLAVACAGCAGESGHERGLHEYLSAAAAAGLQPPEVPWQRLDHAEVMALEARRGIAIAAELGRLHSPAAADPLDALVALLPAQARRQGELVRLSDRAVLTALLEGPCETLPGPAEVAWLGWLLRTGRPVHVTAADGGWDVALDGSNAGALPAGWLAGGIEAATSSPE